jgi:hypothetical protein
MKLNRRKLNIVLPQIKAHLNVAVLADNPALPGSVDFLFQTKAKDEEAGYLNRLTCSMAEENSLFGNEAEGVLGKPLTINVALLREALKVGEPDPEINEGIVNGICVLINPDDFKASNVGKSIVLEWKSMQGVKMPSGVEFEMPRIDYELMAETMIPFVSQEDTRHYMKGYFVDLGKSVDFINFCATDGRKLSVCGFPCKHSRLEESEDNGGGVTLLPLNLFIPGSAYSKTQWLVSKNSALIRIQTEDYSIDCWAVPVDGRFPNYMKVIPSKEDRPEWIRLSAKSARNAFDSTKGLVVNYGTVLLNAEDPKSIRLEAEGASIGIDGDASRPMRLRVHRDLMKACFFETPYTKFMLRDVNSSVLAEEPRAVPGTTLSVIKVFMPAMQEDISDEWGVAGTSKARVDGDDYSKCESEEAPVSYGDSEESDFEDEES